MAARSSVRGREVLRDMAAPAGGVFSFPITPRLSGIEDRFHATAHAACSLGFVLPDRLKDFQDVGRANLRHGQFANDWIDVCGQSVLPLLPVLVIAPASLVRRDVGFGHGFERHPRHLCRLSRRKSLSSLPLTFLKRINPGLYLEP